MVLLILSAGNPFVFERLFASYSEAALGMEEPHHLPNHLGSNSAHSHISSDEYISFGHSADRHSGDTHSEDSEPHEHGQPSPTLVLRADASTSGLSSWIVAPTSLCVVAIVYFERSLFERAKSLTQPRSPGDPPGYIENFISSLTLAPQAPPR
jgi:hypothetical protein